MRSMRSILIVAMVLAMASASSARQAPTQYLIITRVWADNPLAAGSVQVVASPTFRLKNGRAGTLDLGNATDGFRLVVLPSDLGLGNVALRVVAESRHGGRVQASTFDLLTGTYASAPTVALRDAAGAFMLNAQGRPLFVEFQTTIRTQ